MAEFCQTCSIELFGKDMKDFINLCDLGKMTNVLCESCGSIWVDNNGRRIDIFKDENNK